MHRPLASAWKTIWLRACGLVCLLVALTGCSSNFVYNRLDTLAGWYLGSLVSLNEQQRDQLQQWLTQTLAWHRQSELQRYADFLRDIADQAQQPGTLARYEQTSRRFEDFWKDLIAKTTPDAASLLRTLSPQQVDELIRNMNEKARERAEEEESDLDDWHREQTKGLTRMVKRWTGSVSEEQKTFIAAAASQLEPTRTEWLASQEAWQQALLTALQAAPGPDGVDPLQRVLIKPANEWTQKYVDKSQRNRQRYLELLGSLDASLSPRQREHFRSELLQLARQLDTFRGNS